MTDWVRRNYRSRLMAGIRQRIAVEKSPSKLILLWAWLMDAGDLPA